MLILSINHQQPKSLKLSLSNSKIGAKNEGRLVGYFCSDSFQLRQKDFDSYRNSCVRERFRFQNKWFKTKYMSQH